MFRDEGGHLFRAILAVSAVTMNDEFAVLLGSSTAPLTRIRDKQKTQEIRKIVTGDQPRHVRLRAALASDVKPPDDLLEPVIISQALRLDDCFKFLPQLSTVARVVEASSVLEAIHNLLRQRGMGNQSLQLARFLKLSKQWEGNKNPTSPSEKTVTQYLNLIEMIVDQPIATTKRPSKKPQANPLPLVLSVACRWAIKCPSVDNLTLALRCLTAAERREGIAVVERYGDVPGLAAEVPSLRSIARRRVESAAKRAEIDDFRRLLQALTGSVAHRMEMDRVIDRLYHEQPRFDDAILRVLSEFADVETSPAMTIRFAVGGEPKAGTMQLATVLLKAWSARNDGQSSSETYEQLAWVLEQFFSLRLRDWVGEKQEYDPRFHEFEPGGAPTSMVEVIRPAVEGLGPAEAGMVIKALVKGVAN